MIARRPLRTTLATAALLAVAFAAAPTAVAQDNPDRSCRDVDFQDPCVVICPAQDLLVEAQGDGSIRVQALVNDTADLYRSEGNQAPELVFGFSPSQTVYLDTNTTVGVSYTYYLVVGPALCAQAEVTSVPTLPTLFASTAAIALASLAYVAARRR